MESFPSLQFPFGGSTLWSPCNRHRAFDGKFITSLTFMVQGGKNIVSNAAYVLFLIIQFTRIPSLSFYARKVTYFFALLITVSSATV